MPTTDVWVRHAAPDSCSPGRQSSQPADAPTKAGAAFASYELLRATLAPSSLRRQLIDLPTVDAVQRRKVTEVLIQRGPPHPERPGDLRHLVRT
jgi:hypothetical protein